MDNRDLIFVCGDQRVTRAEYHERVGKAARVLSDSGIHEGDAIGVAMRNRPEFFELIAAATSLGARSVPIAWRLKHEEVAYVIQDSGAKIVFFDLDSNHSMEGLPSVSLERYEELLGSIDLTRDAGVTTTGFSIELYSSGTTGRPKAIERDIPRDSGGPPAMVNFLSILGVAGPGEVHMFCGPLYHSQPIGFATQALAAGHRVVMLEGSFDAEECLRAIDQEGVTWLTCVPTHLIRILALPDEVLSRYNLSSVKAVFHSAAPCPRDVKARAMELFPPNTIWEVYGGTEGAMTMISPQEWQKKPGSVGRALPNIAEIRILDSEGNDLPLGEVGLIYGQAPMSFHYRGAPELDAQTWKGSLYTLGDMGYLDEDGYLFVTDRMKDMIITGGANVYPSEVEAVLFNHPAVGDAAVIGVPDEEWGEAILAIVEPRLPITAEEVIDYCRQHLAHYKCPRFVEFMDQLPRDPNGKIRKRELREPYWAHAGRAV